MALNWRELEKQLQELRILVEGSVWQKFSQLGAPGGGELYTVQGFSAKNGPYQLIFSLHNDACFLGTLESSQRLGQNLPANTFVMVLRKHILGPRITRLNQPEGERVVRVEFESGKVLLIELIPRRANLVLVDDWQDEEDYSGRYLGSAKQVSLETGGRYRLTKSQPFEPKEVRSFSEESGDSFNQRILSALLKKVENDSFERSRNAVLQAARAALKKLNLALRNAEQDAEKLNMADTWREQALALSAQLYSLGPKKYPATKTLDIPSVDGERMVKLNLDTNRSFSENAEQLFTKVKKLGRAQTEFDERGGRLKKKIAALESVMASITTAEDDAGLMAQVGRLEKFGVNVQKLQKASNKKKEVESQAKDYLEVLSSDGFRIICGRNQIENRRVTFQAADSADMWLHLKGVAGSHVIIKAQKKKTYPLSTLLEAAQFCLFYSKVKAGKRSDVDYTLRKFVRAIKGTPAEVTYTDNKTLYVESDPAVVRKLLQAAELSIG